MDTKRKITHIKKGVNWHEVAKRIAFTLVIGVISGLASVFLCLCVGLARDTYVQFPWLLYCLPLLGVLSLLLYRALKLPLDLLTFRIIDAMQRDQEVPITVAPGILLGTCITILGGGSVGKEAGALQIGASLGSFIGKKMHIKSLYKEEVESSLNVVNANSSISTTNSDASEADQDAKTETSPAAAATDAKAITAAKTKPDSSNKEPHAKHKQPSGSDTGIQGYTAATGMAATFAALFFAPLGSALFVLEQNHFKRSINRHVLSIVLACFIAFAISSFIGIGDAIDKVPLPEISQLLVGQCAVVGLAAAIIGSLVANAINWVHDITWRISKNYYIWVIVGGIIYIALITLCDWSSYTGSGSVILNDLLKSNDPSFDPGGFAIKALLTFICLGFWFKGGEIMPSLCIGGLLGAACTYLTGGSPQFGAIIGVVSYFAAFSRCPIGSYVMGCEIFGWDYAPWLAIGVIAATLCSSPIGIYGRGIDDALRTRWTNMLEGSFRHHYHSLRQADRAHQNDVPDVITAVEDAASALHNSFAQPETLVPAESDKKESLDTSKDSSA